MFPESGTKLPLSHPGARKIDQWRQLWDTGPVVTERTRGNSVSFGERRGWWPWRQRQQARAAASNAPITAGGISITDPIVGDLAAASSDLVFGDGVRFQFDGNEAEGTTAALLQDIQPVLIEAAEECAALGGIYLLPIVENDELVVDMISADCVRPYWQGRKLRSAITLQKLAPVDEKDMKTVWRLVTCYKHDGTIAYRLNRGTDDKLGPYVDIALHPETEAWWPVLTSPDEHVEVLSHGVQPLVYVPNMFPSRTEGAPMLGRADIDGSEDALLWLNDTETAWHREVRMARARSIIQEQFLTRVSPASSEVAAQAAFGDDHEYFTVVGNQAHSEGGAMIEAVQPDIRADQFLKTVRQVLDRIMVSAGYSPTTLSTNLEGSAPTSGVALSIRERQTQRTVAKKRRYWEQGLRGLVERMFALDPGGGHPNVAMMGVRWPDTSGVTLESRAQALAMMVAAEAISIEERVKYLRPEWTVEDQAVEVERLRAQAGMLMDPTIIDIP